MPSDQCLFLSPVIYEHFRIGVDGCYPLSYLLLRLFSANSAAWILLICNDIYAKSTNMQINKCIVVL